MISIKKRTQDDHKLLSSHFIKDGSVPPIVFFHFSELDKDISEMMNKTRDGSLAVKDGFYLSLTGDSIRESQGKVLSNLALIFAALKHLDVLGELESIVFTTEAYGTEVETDVEDFDFENAKSMFTSFGVDKNGKKFQVVEDKLITLSTEGAELVSTIELKPTTVVLDTETANSPIINLLWETYVEGLEFVKKDSKYLEFVGEAKDDRVHVFISAIQAALQTNKK